MNLTTELSRKKSLEPIQLCFSLWLEGFLRATFFISVILIVLAFLVGLALTALLGKVPSGYIALLSSVFLFSLLSSIFVRLFSFLRDLFIRFSLIGFIGVICALILCALCATRLTQIFKGQKTVTNIALALIIFWVEWIIVGGLKIEDTESSKHRKAYKITGRIVLNQLKWAVTQILSTLSNLVSGHWIPNLQEEVRKIHDSNSAKRSGVVSADISSDFKAWTDATKLFLTIMTGLTVVFALFGDATNSLPDALKIITVIFLLAPALSCVYMEVFKRQCERQWAILEATPVKPRRATLEEFRETLDALAEGSENRPVLSDQATTRRGIYADHD